MNNPQTKYPAQPLDRLSRLLQAAALRLFEADVIAHPSNAAIARYDESQHVAQYIRLFHDWIPDWAHLTYHDIHLQEDLRRFQATAFALAEEGNKPAAALAKLYPGKPLLNQLELVGEQLKTMAFYLPATASILDLVKTSGRSWNVTNLDYDYLVKPIPLRTEAEAKAGREGEWRYGIELEQIYVRTGSGSVFGEYFILDKQSGNLLAITAACISRSRAQGLAGLDQVLSSQRKDFAPALFDVHQAAPRRAKPRTPNASDLTLRMMLADNHQDRALRAKLVSDIESLSSSQLALLAARTKVPQGERYIALLAMEHALKQVMGDKGTT